MRKKIPAKNTSTTCKEAEMAKQKSFEELTFADNYMFTYVMRNLDDCKTLLEILLKIKITEIFVPESEPPLPQATMRKASALTFVQATQSMNTTSR